MQHAVDVLEKFGVPNEKHVMSAHRTPDVTSAFASGAQAKGLEVIIAGAGGAAHLAGVVAAHTTIPVLGVPITSALLGLDSLLSTAQMPGGIPGRHLRDWQGRRDERGTLRDFDSRELAARVEGEASRLQGRTSREGQSRKAAVITGTVREILRPTLERSPSRIDVRTGHRPI